MDGRRKLGVIVINAIILSFLARRARLPPPRACPLHRSVLTQFALGSKARPSLVLHTEGRVSNLTRFDAPRRHFYQVEAHFYQRVLEVSHGPKMSPCSRTWALYESERWVMFPAPFSRNDKSYSLFEFPFFLG